MTVEQSALEKWIRSIAWECKTGANCSCYPCKEADIGNGFKKAIEVLKARDDPWPVSGWQDAIHYLKQYAGEL